MLNTESPDQLVPVWKALSDGTRRRILDLLHERPMTTGAIAGSFEISRIAVMKHLAVLQGAGLILSQKQGRERWHHLNFVPLRQIYERWLDPERGRWAEALVGLKHHSEGYVPMTAERDEDHNTLWRDPGAVCFPADRISRGVLSFEEVRLSLQPGKQHEVQLASRDTRLKTSNVEFLQAIDLQFEMDDFLNILRNLNWDLIHHNIHI